MLKSKSIVRDADGVLADPLDAKAWNRELSGYIRRYIYEDYKKSRERVYQTDAVICQYFRRLRCSTSHTA